MPAQTRNLALQRSTCSNGFVRERQYVVVAIVQTDGGNRLARGGNGAGDGGHLGHVAANQQNPGHVGVRTKTDQCAQVRALVRAHQPSAIGHRHALRQRQSRSNAAGAGAGQAGQRQHQQLIAHTDGAVRAMKAHPGQGCHQLSPVWRRRPGSPCPISAPLMTARWRIAGGCFQRVRHPADPTWRAHPAGG